MRKRTILPIVSVISAVGLFLRIIFIVHTAYGDESPSDIAIIGGADGPTANYMISTLALHDPVNIALAITCLITLIVFCIMLIIEHRKK